VLQVCLGNRLVRLVRLGQVHQVCRSILVCQGNQVGQLVQLVRVCQRNRGLQDLR